MSIGVGTKHYSLGEPLYIGCMSGCLAGFADFTGLAYWLNDWLTGWLAGLAWRLLPE